MISRNIYVYILWVYSEQGTSQNAFKLMLSMAQPKDHIFLECVQPKKVTVCRQENVCVWEWERERERNWNKQTEKDIAGR